MIRRNKGEGTSEEQSSEVKRWLLEAAGNRRQGGHNIVIEGARGHKHGGSRNLVCDGENQIWDECPEEGDINEDYKE